MSLPSTTSRCAHAGRLLGLALLSVSAVSCIVEERGVVYRRHVAPYHQPVYAPASQRAYQPTYQPVYRPPYQPSYQPSYQPTYRPPHHSHLDYTQPVYVEERVYPSLPFGARVTYVRGQRCWFYNGSYYRPHPRGTGFTIFIP